MSFFNCLVKNKGFFDQLENEILQFSNLIGFSHISEEDLFDRQLAAKGHCIN